MIRLPGQFATINERGQVVGTLNLAEREVDPAVFHAFLWEKGKTSDLGKVARSNDSVAWDLNEQNQVVGESEGRATLWTLGPAH